jgi:hypothetical protein
MRTKRNDDARGCRDDDGPKVSGSDYVSWMTRAGLEDCKRYAAQASLAELHTAHQILVNDMRGKNKTRIKAVAGALKRRFGVTVGTDTSEVQFQGKKAEPKTGGRES